MPFSNHLQLSGKTTTLWLVFCLGKVIVPRRHCEAPGYSLHIAIMEFFRRVKNYENSHSSLVVALKQEP